MSHRLEDYLPLLEQRDDAAFAAVYEATKKGVYSMIAGIVHDRQTIEDLMQDTYMKMLAKLDSYERGRNFAAWLFQIAKNLAYDHVRKQNKTTVLDSQENGNVFDKAQDVEPAAEKTTMAEMLSCLNEEERQIVLLRSVSETPFKDIAQTMNKPLGTVLWLYQRALKKLKTHLERR